MVDYPSCSRALRHASPALPGTITTTPPATPVRKPQWVDKFGSGTTAGAATAAPTQGRPGSPGARIARLEAENAALRAEQAKLAQERDILRQAAKYFAGETNW